MPIKIHQSPSEECTPYCSLSDRNRNITTMVHRTYVVEKPAHEPRTVLDPSNTTSYETIVIDSKGDRPGEIIHRFVPGPGLALTPFTEGESLRQTLEQLSLTSLRNPAAIDDLLAAKLPIPRCHREKENLIVSNYNIAYNVYPKMLEEGGVMPLRVDFKYKNRPWEIWLLPLKKSLGDIPNDDIIPTLKDMFSKNQMLEFGRDDLVKYTSRKKL